MAGRFFARRTQRLSMSQPKIRDLVRCRLAESHAVHQSDSELVD
jgi:hypothetical protein